MSNAKQIRRTPIVICVLVAALFKLRYEDVDYQDGKVANETKVILIDKYFTL